MPHAEIARKQALFTLAALYAELAGKLKRPRRDAAKVRVDIEHVAAVILLLDPTFDLAQIRPIERYKPNPLFRRGECFRMALEVLREAGKPLTSKEVAMRMLQKRGVPEPKAGQIRHMAAVVHSSFRNHQNKAVWRLNDGTQTQWKIKL